MILTTRGPRPSQRILSSVDFKRPRRATASRTRRSPFGGLAIGGGALATRTDFDAAIELVWSHARSRPSTRAAARATHRLRARDPRVHRVHRACLTVRCQLGSAPPSPAECRWSVCGPRARQWSPRDELGGPAICCPRLALPGSFIRQELSWSLRGRQSTSKPVIIIRKYIFLTTLIIRYFLLT